MRVPLAVVVLLLTTPVASLASGWDSPPEEDEWMVEPPPAPGPSPHAPPPPAAAARPVDPVLPLVTELRATESWQVRFVIATDGRYARLSTVDRSRLLAALEEPPRWWAPILNVYPGFGLGSLASRDRRGAWLTGSEVLGWSLLFVGVANDVSHPATTTTTHDNDGDGLIVAGALLVVGSRVAGFVLPFTFRGRRHAETERALEQLPAALTVSPVLVPVAPPPGAGGPGAALGLALRF